MTKILLLATRKIWEEVLYECAVGITGPPRQHAVMRLYPDLGAIKFFQLTATSEHFGEHDGVKYLKHLRAHKSVNNGIEVAKESFREIAIRPSNVEEWSPWITALVSIGVGLVGDMRDAHVVPQDGKMTFSITVPLSLDSLDKIEAAVSAMDSGVKSENGEP